MATTGHREPRPAPDAARSWSWLLFRATATVAALLVLGQAALAGGFLSGHYDALAAHSFTGVLLALTLFAQCVAAVWWWRSSRGPSWPVRESLIQFLITGALALLGEQRILTVHMPLAVGLAVGVALLLVRAWGAPPAQSAPTPPRTPIATATAEEAA
ncbi:hypothetical protein [Micromonospora okii]|uniref:hypothetical protein n=1 Tax=Micromonospora okii TaxID=1182970 RepID=UPI001E44D338|nr:hypothetical protein [Micromonospora okii]